MIINLLKFNTIVVKIEVLPRYPPTLVGIFFSVMVTLVCVVIWAFYLSGLIFPPRKAIDLCAD